MHSPGDLIRFNRTGYTYSGTEICGSRSSIYHLGNSLLYRKDEVALVLYRKLYNIRPVSYAYLLFLGTGIGWIYGELKTVMISDDTKD